MLTTSLSISYYLPVENQRQWTTGLYVKMWNVGRAKVNDTGTNVYFITSICGKMKDGFEE